MSCLVTTNRVGLLRWLHEWVGTHLPSQSLMCTRPRRGSPCVGPCKPEPDPDWGVPDGAADEEDACAVGAKCVDKDDVSGLAPAETLLPRYLREATE